MQLACFQPINEKPETLEEILRARADPNLIVGDDARMRELLLAYGASESAFERQRWAERRAADACDAAWLENDHRSAHQPYAATAVSCDSRIHPLRPPRLFVQCR